MVPIDPDTVEITPNAGPIRPNLRRKVAGFPQVPIQTGCRTADLGAESATGLTIGALVLDSGFILGGNPRM